MASELRVNSSTNRSGLGTITYTDSGPIVSGVGTFANGLTVDGTQTTVKSLKLTGDNYNANWFKSTNKLRFNDNAKATFGTADDLSIYHDGSHSILNDSQGSLLLRSNIVQISTPAGSKYFKGQSGVAELYYSDSKKFETTNTGAVVSGILTATTFAGNGDFVDIDVDGHTELDNVNIAGVTTTGNLYADNLYANSFLTINNNSNVSINLTSTSTSGSSRIFFGDPDSALVGRLTYSHNGDYMQFYTGYGEKLRIQGNGFVGIGTNNAATKVHIYDASADPYLKIGGGGRDCGIQLDAATNFTAFRTDAANRLYVNAGADSIRFSIGGTGSEKLRIDSSGRLIVGSGSHGGGTQVVIKGGGVNTYSTLGMYSNHTNPAADTLLSQIRFGSNATADGADIRAHADADWGTNDYPTRIGFYLAPDGSNSRHERFRISSNGNVTIDDGNLIVASGHGIDFSATGGPASGTGGSELLDDYEEGTFTPGWFDDGGVFVSSYSVQYGQYTKIGNVVYFCFGLRISSFSRTPNSGQACRVGNLPFVSRFVSDDQECVFNLYARLWGSGTPPETAWIRQSSGGSSGSNHVDFYMDESQTGNDHALLGADFDTSSSCRVVVTGFYYVS